MPRIIIMAYIHVFLTFTLIAYNRLYVLYIYIMIDGSCYWPMPWYTDKACMHEAGTMPYRCHRHVCTIAWSCHYLHTA